MGQCNGGDGVCLAEVPIDIGWAGYYSVYTTVFGTEPVECPDGSAPERVFSEPSTAMAACSACQCGGAQYDCDAPLTAYSDVSCDFSATGFGASDECDMIHALFVNDVDSVTTGQAAAPGASCPASGGGADVPPMWAKEHALCSAATLPGGLCAEGDVCVDRSDVQICIRSEANVAGCPDGWETALRITSYANGADDRGCAPCTCTPPPDICRNGTYQFFTGFNCNGSPNYTATEGTSCAVTSGSNSARYVAPSPGPCTPSGGAPSGAVAPGQTITLCCR